MPKRSSKQKDTQLDAIAGDAEAKPPEPEKNPAAVALGRLGGLKGGPARAKKLGKERLSESARKAARARWGKVSDIDRASTT